MSWTVFHLCSYCANWVPDPGINHFIGQGRMTETSGAVTTSGVVILEESEASGAVRGRHQGERGGMFRCAFWPRQQTWLCVVPLLIGFVGLGLSLMLLKWIVVGSVKDYVPTDLVDAKGIGQDPIFLSKPSTLPKGPESTTSSTTTTTAVSTISTITTAVRGKTRTFAPPNHNHRDGGSSGSQVTPKSTTMLSFGTPFPGFTSTSSPTSSKPTVQNDSIREHSTTERPVNAPTKTHVSRKTRESYNVKYFLLLWGFLHLDDSIDSLVTHWRVYWWGLN